MRLIAKDVAFMVYACTIVPWPWRWMSFTPYNMMQVTNEDHTLASKRLWLSIKGLCGSDVPCRWEAPAESCRRDYERTDCDQGLMDCIAASGYLW